MDCRYNKRMTDLPETPNNTSQPIKERLDKLLVDLGLCDTRSKAQRLIMAGQVLVKEQKIDKAGTVVKCLPSEVRVLEDLPYVSRGGFKIEKALKAFDITPEGSICLDLGASTGGFTDCLLKHGASKVYAVDVGTNQLDWSLRSNDRVVVLEKTNAKALTKVLVPDEIDLVSIDVSFISLKKVLPPVKEFLKDTGYVVGLIKPQFEFKDYFPDDSKFDGVVKDSKQREVIVRGVLNDLISGGWFIHGLDVSPIKGPKGNVEFLVLLSQNPEGSITPENAMISFDFNA